MLVTRLTKSQRLLVIIAVSFSFFLAEIAVGFYTRALVLVADAFHYLTDLIGYLVAFAAFKVSERGQAPKVLPFGWQRATLLGAFFNSVFLFGLGVSIFLQSIGRFVSIERIENPKLVLVVGCVGLALNVFSATILHQHSHDDEATTATSVDLRGHVLDTNQHQAHRHKSIDQKGRRKASGHDLGVLGILLHVMSDAMNNVGVIIAGAIIWKTSYAARFYADPAVSMAIAVVIMLSSVPLMKRSGTILMQSTPSGVDPDDVKHDLETLPGILAVHDLHVWVLNQEKAIASAHIVVSDDNIRSVDDFMQLANTVNECFHAYGIHSATLQPEVVLINKGDVSTKHAEEELSDRVGTGLICRIGCRTTSCEASGCCDW